MFISADQGFSKIEMQVGDDEVELSGSSVALFDDSDVAGIFFEKETKTPPPPPPHSPAPSASVPVFVPALVPSNIPARNESFSSLGSKLKSLSSFDDNCVSRSNINASPLLSDKQSALSPISTNDALVEDLKDQISRLEQDNVTLLEELDNVIAKGSDDKNARNGLEKTVSDLQNELEVTKSEFRELSFNVSISIFPPPPAPLLLLLLLLLLSPYSSALTSCLVFSS